MTHPQTNKHCNVRALTTVVGSTLLSNRPQTASLMCKYYAFKGAPIVIGMCKYLAFKGA